MISRRILGLFTVFSYYYSSESTEFDEMMHEYSEIMQMLHLLPGQVKNGDFTQFSQQLIYGIGNVPAIEVNAYVSIIERLHTLAMFTIEKLLDSKDLQYIKLALELISRLTKVVIKISANEIVIKTIFNLVVSTIDKIDDEEKRNQIYSTVFSRIMNLIIGKCLTSIIIRKMDQEITILHILEMLVIQNNSKESTRYEQYSDFSSKLIDMIGQSVHYINPKEIDKSVIIIEEIYNLVISTAENRKEVVECTKKYSLFKNLISVIAKAIDHIIVDNIKSGKRKEETSKYVDKLYNLVISAVGKLNKGTENSGYSYFSSQFIEMIIDKYLSDDIKNNRKLEEVNEYVKRVYELAILTVNKISIDELRDEQYSGLSFQFINAIIERYIEDIKKSKKPEDLNEYVKRLYELAILTADRINSTLQRDETYLRLSLAFIYGIDMIKEIAKKTSEKKTDEYVQTLYELSLLTEKKIKENGEENETHPILKPVAPLKETELSQEEIAAELIIKEISKINCLINGNRLVSAISTQISTHIKVITERIISNNISNDRMQNNNILYMVAFHLDCPISEIIKKMEETNPEDIKQYTAIVIELSQLVSKIADKITDIFYINELLDRILDHLSYIKKYEVMATELFQLDREINTKKEVVLKQKQGTLVVLAVPEPWSKNESDTKGETKRGISI